jgi:hypothetical protein
MTQIHTLCVMKMCHNNTPSAPFYKKRFENITHTKETHCK